MFAREHKSTNYSEMAKINIYSTILRYNYNIMKASLSLSRIFEKHLNQPITDLNTLMTRQVMRTAVNTQIKITMFFRVGRYSIINDMRDSVVVPLFVKSSSRMDGVEYNCVAGEGRVCGSPVTCHATAKIKVKMKLYVVILHKSNTSCQ